MKKHQLRSQKFSPKRHFYFQTDLETLKNAENFFKSNIPYFQKKSTFSLPWLMRCLPLSVVCVSAQVLSTSSVLDTSPKS